jgi:hypothetical protein
MATTTPLLGVSLTETPTTNSGGPFDGLPLGTTVKATDGTEYVRVQASGAIAQYDAVGIDENFAAAPLTTAMAGDGWFIGFAQVAFASADYGWVATRGSNINCKVAAACAADVALFTTATAGTLDDATTTTKIDGIVAVTAVGTAAGNVEIIATQPKSSAF